MENRELSWEDIQIEWKKGITAIFEVHKDKLEGMEEEIFELWLRGHSFNHIADIMSINANEARSIHSSAVDRLIDINKRENEDV